MNARRVLTALALAAGLVLSTAPAHAAGDHDCITSSNGFTYNCETGLFAWDASVSITDANDEAVLYDASTTPQTRVFGPARLPHGPGPAGVVLGAFPCGPYQWDIYTGGKHFIAGHKGSGGPCQTPTTTTTSPTSTPSTTTATTKTPSSTSSKAAAAPGAPVPTHTSTSASSTVTSQKTSAPELAATGDSWPWVALAGFVLILGGAGALWVRRKVTP